MEAASVYLTLKGKMTSLSQLKYQEGSQEFDTWCWYAEFICKHTASEELTSGKLKGHRVNL